MPRSRGRPCAADATWWFSLGVWLPWATQPPQCPPGLPLVCGLLAAGLGDGRPTGGHPLAVVDDLGDVHALVVRALVTAGRLRVLRVLRGGDRHQILGQRVLALRVHST